MVLHSNNPWETEDVEQLVSIGSHRLWMSTSGPVRKAHEPVILFFTGGGAPAVTYRRLQHLLSVSWRVYFHDRSGYDRSERGSDRVLTGQQAAKDLVGLLAQVAVGPPYVLMGHSYGGIVVRAFLELQPPDAVVGVVLADTATELMYQLFPPQIPAPALLAVADGINWAELTGLQHDMRLTEEEYQEVLDAQARTGAAVDSEDCRASAYTLAQRQQFQKHILTPWPVLVVRCNMAKDYRTLYDAGVRKGQGTEKQRADAMSFIESWEVFDDQVRAAQLRLSCCHRYAYYEEVGHDDILRRPEAYVEETRWVMEKARRQRNSNPGAHRCNLQCFSPS